MFPLLEEKPNKFVLPLFEILNTQDLTFLLYLGIRWRENMSLLNVAQRRC